MPPSSIAHLDAQLNVSTLVQHAVPNFLLSPTLASLVACEGFQWRTKGNTVCQEAAGFDPAVALKFLLVFCRPPLLHARGIDLV